MNRLLNICLCCFIQSANRKTNTTIKRSVINLPTPPNLELNPELCRRGGGCFFKLCPNFTKLTPQTQFLTRSSNLHSFFAYDHSYKSYRQFLSALLHAKQRHTNPNPLFTLATKPQHTHTHIHNMHTHTLTHSQLAGGLLSGRYSSADIDKQPEGRFWTVGGRWSKV